MPSKIFKVYFFIVNSFRNAGTLICDKILNCSLILAGGEILRPSVFMLPPVEHARKDQVTLTCYVKDFFPKEVFVSWLIDDEEQNSKYHTTSPIENNGSYSAYGQLVIPLKEWQNDGLVYSCAVHHESMGNTTKVIVRSVGKRTFDTTNLVNLNMNIRENCEAQ